jgi:hypothetical protein
VGFRAECPRWLAGNRSVDGLTAGCDRELVGIGWSEPHFELPMLLPLFVFLLLCGAFCSACAATVESIRVVPDGDNAVEVWEVSGFDGGPFVGKAGWGHDYGPIDRQIRVLDTVTIMAEETITDAELQHVASVMAELLDNDEDGTIDDPGAAAQLRARNAMMLVWDDVHDPSQRESDGVRRDDNTLVYVAGTSGDHRRNQTLHKNPAWMSIRIGMVDEAAAGRTDWQFGQIDSTLEECFHLLTDWGFGPAYPETFGRRGTSTLLDLMDAARGGKFMSGGPDRGAERETYPEGAWYTRVERCSYECFASEYFYWLFSSLGGVQRHMGGPSEGGLWAQWKANTPELMREKQPQAVALFEDHSASFRLPRNIPNGKYAPNPANRVLGQ